MDVSELDDATFRVELALTRGEFMAALADGSGGDVVTDAVLSTGFDAVTWETPVLSEATSGERAEFVVVNAPDLTRHRADGEPFALFIGDVGYADVTVVDNLGGDARLVIPTRAAVDAVYPHLAAFLRGAPPEQVAMVWQAAGALALRELPLGERWLSTAGGGVAWLHVRLDERPKYYRHHPYRDHLSIDRRSTPSEGW